MESLYPHLPRDLQHAFLIKLCPTALSTPYSRNPHLEFYGHELRDNVRPDQFNRANLTSAKSGRNWTQGDLDAYNIQVVPQEMATFFVILALPESRVSAEILNTLEADDMVDDSHARLIDLLDIAMIPLTNATEESAVDDSAVELFRLPGYVGRRRFAHTRKRLPFPICGETRHVKIDVCLVDRLRDHILLIVQEDKCGYGEHPVSTFADTEAQLVAGAIAAAFVYNNQVRRINGSPELQEKVGPSSNCFACLLNFVDDGRSRYGRNHSDVL